MAGKKKTEFTDWEEESIKVEKAYRAFCPRDFTLFIQGLKIPSGQGPRLLGSCLAPFQQETFASLAPSLHAVRDGTMPPLRRFWIERTKKASKDGDIGASLLWLVCFPQKPLYIQVGAADRDQAAIIKRRISDILFQNPWLDQFVELQANKVIHKGGLAEIDIIAADVAGSHGETPNLLVINELSHVTKWEFVENLLDNADGVPDGVVILATNAGFRGTKAEILRKNALASPDWRTFIWDKPAPWHSKSSLEDARRRNPPSRYKRLWWGQWASGKGDAFDEGDIDSIFKPELKELTKPIPQWRYIAGLDVGVNHDHAGFVIAGIHYGLQLIRVVLIRAWEPSAETGEVDLLDVENSCLKLCRHFRVERLCYDPHQAKLMMQRLARMGVQTEQVNFSGKNLNEMANTLKSLISSRRLESYEDLEGRLRADFGKFNIVEKSYGLRLEAVSDETGHADVGTALVLMLPRAMAMLDSGTRRLMDEDELVLDGTDLTKEEIQQMPAEFLEIMEAHGGPVRRSLGVVFDE